MILWPGKSSSGATKSREMTHQGLANSCLRQAGIGQAPVSHLSASPNHGRWLTGAGQFWLMTSRNWLGPGKSSSVVTPESHLAKSEKRIFWNQLPKVIFRGPAIPACPKPELIRIFKLTFLGLKNPGRWIWLDKVISEILKPLKMVLCSSREIVSLNFFFLTCRAPSLVQLIEWTSSGSLVQMAGIYL